MPRCGAQTFFVDRAFWQLWQGLRALCIIEISPKNALVAVQGSSFLLGLLRLLREHPPIPDQMLRVATPAGEEVIVPAEAHESVKDLKAKLQATLGTAPGGMRILHGTEILDDTVKLEKALQEDELLSLIVSPLPDGTFQSKEYDDSNAPAGLNTNAEIVLKFGDGKCTVWMHESEITSDSEDEDYDEYEQGAAWEHEYWGEVRAAESTNFTIIVQGVKRKGCFSPRVPEPVEIHGALSGDEINVELPFAAGGCNRGTAGLTWVSLGRP